MSGIRVDNLHKTFDNRGTKFIVFDGISFEIKEHSFTSIMGPSGCGKSTILNILAGLETMDKGSIIWKGEEINPGDFFYGYVFQEPRLLNWLTVEENIKFALKAKNISEDKHDGIIQDQLNIVGLQGEEESYPLQLSGGMRQRVGLARALAINPDIILMDEPFGSLDEITARKLREDVIDIWQQTKKTIVFVTHNINEAVYLSDRILMLNTRGEIFHSEIIELERPRSIDDTELLETESQITKKFMANVELE